MIEKKLHISLPVQGSKQFLTSRKEMLDAFDSAREKARAHEVETYHGHVAEAGVRRWLTSFLPKRFAVTAGYVISQGIGADTKAPHFDVIIYDALNSPVLWVEEDAGPATGNRSMAIPAEHVLMVLEIKSAFSSADSKKAVDHLNDLGPLLESIDLPNDPYKLHLPPNFSCGVIFYELRTDDLRSEAALLHFFKGRHIRGFFGGLILRAEGAPPLAAGQLRLISSPTPFISNVSKGMNQGFSTTDSEPIPDGMHVGGALTWSEIAFPSFSFDLIALLQGSFDPTRVSSFHGTGGVWENNW